MNKYTIRRKGSKFLIDSVNGRILDELNDNSRITITQLSRTIGLNRSAVRERIAEMEAAGIIEGYTVMVNWDLVEEER